MGRRCQFAASSLTRSSPNWIRRSPRSRVISGIYRHHQDRWISVQDHRPHPQHQYHYQTRLLVAAQRNRHHHAGSPVCCQSRSPDVLSVDPSACLTATPGYRRTFPVQFQQASHYGATLHRLEPGPGTMLRAAADLQCCGERTFLWEVHYETALLSSRGVSRSAAATIKPPGPT